MSDGGPYSRLYWRFRDEFPEVYQDKETLGWWATLLMIADGAHPSAADLPRRLKESTLKKLVDAELVTMFPGDRYRMRGVEAERNKRAEAARVGGLASGRSRAERTIVEQPLNGGSKQIEPSRDEQSKEEKRRAIRPVEEEPFVTLEEDGKEARRQREKDELMARTMQRLGVRP